jgi:site-specific recombinase XerD
MVMYDLRHTFATRAVERGVDLPKLMAILGHANLRSIMRYVHMSRVHIAEGMRRFEEVKVQVTGSTAKAERQRKVIQ